jgi:tetratricopeptide (TPR) repeat protein
VKSTQRHAATAAGFLVLSLASTPVFAQASPAQRGGPPGQDTPYILVATFQSTDRKLGVDAADEVRKRIQGEHAAKELYAVPKTSINSTLEASGYRPDSALNASDLMELSKQLHGEYVIDGKATKSAAGGVRLEARLLMRTGQLTLAQPLPPVDGKDAGDAAKGVEKAISDALKGMPSYKLCTNDLRALKYDDAAKDARAGIQAYPNSALNRLCLLSAYNYSKAPADSVISLANQILALDPSSMLALTNLADAYSQKGDSANAIATNLKIYRLDPTNSAVVGSIVRQLAQSGAPDKALPMIDSLLINDPSNAEMIRTKWLLQLKAKQWKAAIATGEQLIKVDTTAATVDFYNRQIGAAQGDSNTAAVQELAAKAGQKFPTDASFQLLLAQSYNKSGQLQQSLQAARRATQIDPKNENAWQFALAAASGMNQPDTVKAIAAQAIAAGIPATSIGTRMLAPVSAAVAKAQASKTRADWLEALKAAEEVDAVAPSPQSKFFIGVSSFQAAADIVAEVQTLVKSTKKADKDQACTNAKQAEDLLAKTSVAMPAGGSVEPTAAGQILSAVGQYAEYIPQVKKAFCK